MNSAVDFHHLQNYFLLISIFISSVQSDCKLPNFAQNLPPEVELYRSIKQPITELYPERFTLQFYCKRGFKPLRGDHFIICINNEWKVDGNEAAATALQCTRKPCPIVLLDNGTIDMFNDEITYSCRDGFRLRGKKSAKCALDEKENYYVTSDPPICEEIRKCSKPENSLLVFGNDCCIGGNVYNFSCPNGLSLEGKSSLKCNDDGEWEEPGLPSCKDRFSCGIDKPIHLSEEERRLPSRISGGKNVEFPWPWLAVIKFGVKIRCGGAIISERWILSAAHCFIDRMYKRYWKVVVGVTDLAQDTGKEFNVEAIFLHENFNKSSLDCDIALLKLENPISFSNIIRPICLPPFYNDLPRYTTMYEANQFAVVAGWGHDQSFKINDYPEIRVVDHLKEIEIPLQEKTICSTPVKYEVCRNGRCIDLTATPTDTMFCAGDGLEGGDACPGDSGAPLMQRVDIKDKSVDGSRWFAIGVVSWGVGCGQKGFYGYYSHVAKLRQWINEKTQIQFEDVFLHGK